MATWKSASSSKITPKWCWAPKNTSDRNEQLAKKQGTSTPQKKNATKQEKPGPKQSGSTLPTPTTQFAPSFDLPKKDRSNIVFRQLRTLSSNTPLGIAYGRHDGSTEGIQQTAEQVGEASYERYGNDLGNMASQYWATGGDGHVQMGDKSESQIALLKLPPRRPLKSRAQSLEQWDVDTSRFTREPKSPKLETNRSLPLLPKTSKMLTLKPPNKARPNWTLS
ncbi:MAG: hypothetical protein U5K69_13105 [Balneolaceae bacterium]|nr:hypothetical protein [Balneolaceae bacterium]